MYWAWKMREAASLRTMAKLKAKSDQTRGGGLREDGDTHSQGESC